MRSITPVGRDARYSPLAVFLHWVVAALILTNWLLPHIAEYLPRSMAPQIIGVHRSIGVTVLVLVLLRAVWRLISPPPALPSGTAQLVRIAAQLRHAALYLLMLSVPVLGVLFTWAGGRTLMVWGVIQIPPPSWVDPDMHDTFRSLHGLTANAILWLVGFHVAAALIHHYVFKDGLLDRMLPARLTARRRAMAARITS